MKRVSTGIILISLLIVSLLVIPACNRPGSSMNGSGQLIDQDVNLIGFTGVDVQGPFQADIVQSDSFRVIVNTDENLINRIDTSLDGETIVATIKAPATFFPTSLKIKIGMPRIYQLKLSDGAKGSVSGFKSTFNFSVVLTDGSSLTGSIDAGNCDFDVSGESQITMKGSALGLNLEESGKSKLDMENFAINTAKLHLSQGSEAILNLNGGTDVRLEQTSIVYYLGNPTFNNTAISGGSFMKHK